MATPKKKTLKNYTEESMLSALADCDRGLSVAASAKKHGVPRITLLYKTKGKYPRTSKMGPESYLNKEEEGILCGWIVNTAKAGFPISKNQLLDSVQQLIRELKRPTPFKNDRPGKKWCSLFLNRNPQISLRTPQNLTNSRASVTQERLDAWFQEVFEYLQNSNQDNILNYPARVFNCDEAAFFLNPKGDKVFAKKGEKNVYQVVNSDEKECLTVLVTGNAAGDMPPPMIIFRYERIPKDIAFSVPESWGIGKSDSGWMTGETFYEFIANIFYPWLVEKQIELPVILFIDGHASHLTLHTSRFCAQKGIILVALYPNATHLIQPMDVAVFRTLKGGWRENTKKFRLERSQNPFIKKIDFAKLLKFTMDERLHPNILKNGFRKCGLCPWNPREVQLKDVSFVRDNEKKTDLAELKKFEEGKRFLQTQIDKEKINKFIKMERWEGAVEDISLFQFYKKIEQKVNKLRKEVWGEDLKNSVCVDQDENGPENGEGDNSVTKDKLFEIDSQNDKQSSAIIYVNSVQPSTSSEKTPIKIISNVLIQRTNEKNVPSPSEEPTTSQERTPLKMISNKLQNPEQNHKEDKTIPSPFKRALIWPEPKPVKKKRAAKEKIPSVVTSKAWQDYHESKERKKEEEEEQKKKKAEERQKKKELQIKLKEQKKAAKENKRKAKNHLSKKRTCRYSFSSDSETSDSWKSSGSSDDIQDDNMEKNSDEEKQLLVDIRNQDKVFKESDYVLVEFPGKKRQHRYVCVIQRLLSEREAEVVAMKQCENTEYFKLNEDDVSIICLKQIIKKLMIPDMVVCGDRLKYKFKEQLSVDG